MISRLLVRAGAVAVSLWPAAALAQDVSIDHEEVKCIVAGKFPRMDACFTPVSSVGKARLYFRPETLPTWFYVDMAADEACHFGTLPRPSKALIDKKIFYYVDVQGAGTARTPEYAPVVVARAADCKNLLAAPFAASGPTGVFPSLPAGFGGGLSATVIGAGIAAVAVTGTAVAAGGGDDPASPVPTTPSVPTTSPPVTAPPGTTLPGGPVTDSPLVAACEAAPRGGQAPLRVDFATFPSGGTGSYEFLWTFGDGESSTNPNPAHTFLNDGIFEATVRVTSGDETVLCTRLIAVVPVRESPVPPPTTTPSPSPSPSPSNFRLQVVVVGTGTGTVTGPGINCPTDCDEFFTPGTVVTITATPAAGTVFNGWTGQCTGTAPCTLVMNSNHNAVAHFELATTTLTVQGGANSDIAGSVTSNPGGITCAWQPSVPCTDTANYPGGTTVTLTVTTAGLRVTWGGACAGATGLVCTVFMNGNKNVTVDTLRMFQARAGEPAAALTWTSALAVPGAEGQVVANGLMSAVREGSAPVASEAAPGTNRVEAVLVRAAGRPGTWRFDFSGRGGLRPGSLRVAAGNVAVITESAVVFRLAGRAGERIAFSFEREP